MFKKIGAVTTALALAGAGILFTAGPASAHTPELIVECDSLTANLTGYPDGSTIGAVLNDVNLGTTTFGGNYNNTVALDSTRQNDWVVTIDSSDGDQFDKVITGMSSEDCLPDEPVVPPKPEPIVTVEIGEDGDCETGIITRYETPFSQDYTLVDNVWVLGEKVPGETVVSTRPATEVECPVEEPPTEEPPVVEPPVVEPPVVEPPVVEPPVVTPPVVDTIVPVTDTIESLPETGGESFNPFLILAAGVMAFAGVILTIANRTRIARK